MYSFRRIMPCSLVYKYPDFRSIRCHQLQENLMVSYPEDCSLDYWDLFTSNHVLTCSDAHSLPFPMRKKVGQRGCYQGQRKIKRELTTRVFRASKLMTRFIIVTHLISVPTPTYVYCIFALYGTIYRAKDGL